MENFQGNKVNRPSNDPSEQKKYHRTNEFYHRASEAMELPWDAGKSVSQAILRNIVRRISQEEARHLISELPIGLKEECAAFTEGPLKSINAQKVKRDIVNASGIEGVDPQRVAFLFWTFLSGWFNEIDIGRKGETFDVLGQLPKDLKELFTPRT